MPEQEPTTSRNERSGTGFAHVKIPAAFVHPYTHTTKEGKRLEKAIVDIPKGVKVNGVDIGGFKTDVFMSSRMKQQQLRGEQVTLGFRANAPVTIFKGRHGEASYQRFNVRPHDLTHAIKVNNDEFKAAKAAEREAKGADLAEAVEDSRRAASALGGEGMDAPAPTSERQ